MVQLMCRLNFFLLKAGIVDRNQVASTCSGEQTRLWGVGTLVGTFTPIRHPALNLIAAGRDDGRDDGL